MKKLKWTIFKISRQKDGIYLPDLSIDKCWVEKQKRAFVAELSPTTMVFADVFARYVYGCEIPKDKGVYISLVEKSLGSFKNLTDVRFESDIIDEVWSIEEFIKVCNSEIFVKGEILAESIKRNSLYNIMNYSISPNELFNISRRALACLKAEELLEKRFSV